MRVDGVEQTRLMSGERLGRCGPDKIQNWHNPSSAIEKILLPIGTLDRYTYNVHKFLIARGFDCISTCISCSLQTVFLI